MQKRLKNKLDKMEKEQLVEIIESLCSSKETERMLKLILTPTESEIDRVVGIFSRCVEDYLCNSFSDRAYDRMVDSLNPLYTLLRYADSRLSAYAIYEVYQAAREYDLFCYDSADFLFDLQNDLRDILERDAVLFSEAERERYRRAIEE